MLKLDIRQESSRHSDVLDTVTQYLGLGSYKYVCQVTLQILFLCLCVAGMQPRILSDYILPSSRPAPMSLDLLYTAHLLLRCVSSHSEAKPPVKLSE